MKNKKGFTLIELLAIIVILTLIAVIITPIILGIIEDSKISAATDSAYGYKDSIQKFYATMLSQNNDFMLDGEYTINSNGTITDDENTYNILASGTIPNSGYLNIEKGSVVSGCIQINEYAVRLEDKKVTSTKKGYCVEPPVVVEEFPQVTDENPGIICGNGTTEDYDNNTVCYIYSVEDLVAFSNLTNSGKSFQNKTVMLMNNLDIQNDKSYTNVNANQFGDINENSTTEGTLKEELTEETGNGFKPIGNNSNKFSGTFEGNAKTIKNLYINRSSQDYIGLFGYNIGTIKGLKMINANITGKNYVGIFAGYNKGNITSAITDGNATGYSNIGLLTGENYAGTIETIVSGNVTATSTSVGGITGNHGYLGEIKGIFKSGSVTSETSTNVNRVMGTYNSNNPGTKRTGALSTITVNGTQKTSTSLVSTTGYDIPENAINNIAMIDYFIDTYIGGDNNNDGYYYDYDSNGEFTVYKLSEHPLNITMSGSGTSDDPYIINNYDELKQVSYNLGTNGGIYYKLNADIDLANKNPIMLSGGEKNETTKRFTGVFDGNAHTISNLNLIGCNHVGLFGYNTGTIKGLKITNANVSGYSYIGLITGYNTGNITSTIVEGNATGYSNIGLLTGENYAGTIETIVSGNVTATSTSVGGITGNHGYLGEIKGIFKSGSVTSETSTNVNRVMGTYNSNNPGTKRTGALSTITVNGTQKTSTSLVSTTGYDIPENAINNIAMIDYFIDTYIGGDNNNDGYYYDYDSNGEFTVYKLSEHPLNITMSGSGTSDDPYIINNYDELKQVSYNLGTNGGIYYKLNADIDLANKNPIMLSGGEKNETTKRFTGVFDGNAHTISNLNLIGCNHVGLFGYNTGTIKGLKITNANVSGYSYIGLIAGYNTGNVTSTIVEGNVSGNSYIGLLTGENYNGTIETIVSGNITSSSSPTGGITGNHGYLGVIKGIYKSGTITSGASSQVNRMMGTYNNNNGGTRRLGALDAITVKGSTRTSTSLTSTDGKSYTETELQTLAPYEEVGLNMTITDPAQKEYRYAFDSNNNIYLIKN